MHVDDYYYLITVGFFLYKNNEIPKLLGLSKCLFFLFIKLCFKYNFNANACGYLKCAGIINDHDGLGYVQSLVTFKLCI